MTGNGFCLIKAMAHQPVSATTGQSAAMRSHNINLLTRGHIPKIRSNKTDARATNSKIFLMLKLWGSQGY